MKINATAFVREFVRGLSEEELREKFSLTDSQVRRVISELIATSVITRDQEALRKENLRIRFGDAPGPGDPEPRGKNRVNLDTGLVLHCPSCGAAVARGAEQCEYCHSALDFSLDGKTVHCPHCFMKIPALSRFCFRCAKPVKGDAAAGVALEDRPCPRCRTMLVGRTVGDYAVMGCEACGGMFISHETFEMMQDDSRRVVESTELWHRDPPEAEKSIRYVRCPVCKTMMNRKNFAQISGVIVDLCGRHGIWFDAGEMEKIMDFVARGGIQRARSAELERLKDEEAIVRLRKEGYEGTGGGATPILRDLEPIANGSGVFSVLAEAFRILKG